MVVRHHLLLEPLDDLKSNPHSTERPRACSHEIAFSPKIEGISQFHSSQTGMLKSRAMTTTTAAIPSPRIRYFMFCFEFDVVPPEKLVA